MRKIAMTFLLCAATQCSWALDFEQTAQDFGQAPQNISPSTLPFDLPSQAVNWREARIKDVGVVVSQVQRCIRTDALTGRRDTTFQVLPDEIVWQSEGADVTDSTAVGKIVDRRRAQRRAAPTAPASQTGNLMSDYMNGFSYYVFSFDYPSVDANGEELMLSAMAACPPKEGTTEVHNVILGTHITITSDHERPTSHFNNFDQDDWGMLFSMAAGPKLVLKDQYQVLLTLANDISGSLACPIFVGPLLHKITDMISSDQYAKVFDYHDYNYNLVIMPDYEGYGLTRHRAHPYLYQELTARQCIDATRFGIALYNSDPVLDYIRVPMRKNFRTVSCGYSQGGSVAMACHRFVEQNGLTDELHFAGSVCGDGPYDPVATLMYYVAQEKKHRFLSMPVVLPLIVKGMLDTNPYMKCHKAEDYFNPKFLEIGIMQWLNDKEKSTADIEEEFKQLYENGKDGDKSYYRDIFVKVIETVRDEDFSTKTRTAYHARLSAIMNAECYAYFSDLYDRYSDSFTEAAGIPLPTQRGVMEDLHLALASNDMTAGWTPLHNLILFHSKGDTVVPYVNAEKAKNSLGNRTELTTAPNNLDHGDSGTDFFKGDNVVDVGLLRVLSLRIYDYIDDVCRRSFSTENAKKVEGYVLLNGSPIPAEYTVLPDSTVGLGSGRNACISQFSAGRIAVPKTVTIIKKENGKEKERKTYQVSKIMPMAFRLCNRVRFVNIPEGVTSIDNFAFVGCSGLRELRLPSTLENIGSGALIGLNRLNYIACAATMPPRWTYNDTFFFHQNGIGDNATYQFPADVVLAVPAASVERYRQALFSDAAIGWTTPDGWGKAFRTIQGGVNNHFSIYEAGDLMDLHDLFESDTEEISQVILEADIDMEGLAYKPIGTLSHPFTATVRGQGHTIANITSTDNSTLAGLFGYYGGSSITNLRLKDCRFHSAELAGSIAALVGDCRIDSVKVTHAELKGSGNLGGIVAQANGRLIIDRSAVVETSFASTSTDISPLMGGLVGHAENADISNCAVVAQSVARNPMAPFVGSGKARIDYAYANSIDAKGYTPPAGIVLGPNTILTGQPLSILDYAGNKKNFTYDTPYFQAVYPAAILGTDAWAYVMGRYAMPDCLADEWTPQPNFATYGSPGLAASHVNTLTPDGPIPASAWLDLSDQGFRHYRFKGSKLWIDNKLNVEYNYDHLPLGFAEQITATDGIQLDRTLKAEDKGMLDIIEPVYKTDNDDNIVLGDDGQPLCVDSLKIGERQAWAPKGYAFSLPYSVALPDNCSLYQPTRIYDVNGQTTAMMERVSENYVEAFRPYYLVVNTDSVSLGTSAEVVTPQLTTAITQLGDYEFVAAMSQMSNAAARQKKVYFLEDNRQWIIATENSSGQQDVMPFTAYFTPITTTPSKRIVMTLEDSNPVISEGDYYFTINTDSNKPTATITGYRGRGGNTVVPPTVTYVAGGRAQQVPVTGISAAAFTTSTTQVWSIDMSQCAQLKPLTVDRTEPNNPFYRVDDRTIIYLPEGKAPAGKNVVVGEQCAKLTITDGWDFCPPYDFHADEAEYDRIFYASKQQDGSYKSYAYTVCVPFTMSMEEINEQLTYDGPSQGEMHVMYFIDDQNKAFFFWSYPPSVGDGILAGRPYIINMIKGQFQIKAHDTQVIAEPVWEEFPISLRNQTDTSDVGDWQGTFKRIGNEEAAGLGAYTLNGGKWCRIRNDEGRYRSAWIGAFRGYFLPFNSLAYNTYSTYYAWEPQGPEEEQSVYEPFHADMFDVDSDFSNYDDEEVAIANVPATSAGEDGIVYAIDGRKIENGQWKLKNGLLPRGLYIHKGVKVVIR